MKLEDLLRKEIRGLERIMKAQDSEYVLNGLLDEFMAEISRLDGNHVDSSTLERGTYLRLVDAVDLQKKKLDEMSGARHRGLWLEDYPSDLFNGWRA